MLEYLLAIFAILVIYGYIKYYYLPKKNYFWHQKVYEALGYKVKTYEYRLMGLGFFSEWIKSEKEHGDPNMVLKQQQMTKYDIILTNLVGKSVVCFLSPDLIKHLFTLENLDKLPKAKVQTNNFKRVLGQGVLIAQGSVWKRKRKVITKVFNHQLLVANIPKIVKICNEVMDSIEITTRQANPQKNDCYQIDISNIFTQVYSKVMLRSFFGNQFKNAKIDGKDISQVTAQLLSDIQFQGVQLLGLLLGVWVFNLELTAKHRDINRRIALLKDLVKQYLKDRVEEIKKNTNSKPQDIIEALYKYQMEEKKQEQDKYDFDQLIDQFFTFFVAGTDSTKNFTKTLIYYTVLNPKIESRLRQEIDKFIKQDQDIMWENLKKVQYIDWLQNETIRCYGPVNTIFTRQSTQDQYISNVPIKKGDYVVYMSMPSHHNPNIFKDPLEFRPERWGKQCDNIHPFAHIGFSIGPRSCIGRSLALLQSKIAIIKFMKRYKKIKIPCQKLKFQMKFLTEPIAMKSTLRKYKDQ